MLSQLPYLKILPQTLVSLDFETALESGEASIEFYRPDFRAVSCAVSWGSVDKLENYYCESEECIRALLEFLQNQGCRIVAHNIAFEHGVMLYRFKDIILSYHADTMRLAQVYDNGAEFSHTPGLSLVACATRVLPYYSDHKLPYYAYLRDIHNVRRGKEGANLHLLPSDKLAAYNIADTDTTHRLYHYYTEYFKRDKYNWSFDHQFYLSSAFMITASKGRGIVVDRSKLSHSIEALQSELEAIKLQFDKEFQPQLMQMRELNLRKFVLARSSERGQCAAWLRVAEEPGLIEFNLASSSQKQVFFCDILGLSPKFLTPKNKPSFAKAFLTQWGRAGELLVTRGTITISLAQATSLLNLSDYDSKWHIDLKAAGTTTGRMAGGSQ